MTWTKLDPKKISPQARKILQECFRRGNLEPFLHPGQQRIRREFYSCPESIYCVNVGRQFGKSHLAVGLAFELAIRYPRQQIVYAAPTYRMTKTITEPKIREYLDFRPKDYTINWRKKDGELEFPNGSIIRTFGVETDPDRMRGFTSNLVILDEAGIMTNLEYLIESVVLPQFVTTAGRLLMISTPSPTAGHAFRRFISAAKERGAYTHAISRENPMFTAAYEREHIWPACVIHASRTAVPA
ncbi:MAG TPA: terminase family protein [Azospirillum sp.]|nr:terminase family protein [Azospirillum sp.]